MIAERPLLQVAGLDLQRGRRRLAVSVNFTLGAGHYIELTGANGSGKTTLLRVLAGLTGANKHARIEFTHTDAQTGTPPHHSVFHFAARHGFRPELSVRDQLALSLSLFDRSASAADCRDWLTEVGLARNIDQRVGSLSEGQIRRLMLAVMAGAKRRIWLIDEPLNALDADGVALLGRLMNRHLAAGGAAVVATHQTLSQRLPDLVTRFAGSVQLSAQQTRFIANDWAPQSPAPEPHSNPPASFGWVCRREFALLLARPQDALWPAVFHWMVVSLFPFGLGADSALLGKIAPGVFWVSSLLAMLLASQRMFSADFEQGALDQMQVAGLSLPMLAAGKLIAAFIAVGVPLSLASFPLGLQYGLPGGTVVLLAASMLLGLITLASLCAVFAALGLMARQAQVVVSLMSLPCFVPVLIFGTAATDSAQAGLSAQAPLMVLAALAVLSLIALPVVAARVLSLALD